MKVYICPTREFFPERGGVREHLRQLYRQLEENGKVELVSDISHADIVHVESSWYCTDTPDIYVCHGGFVPEPISIVIKNLKNAKSIVSVARWVADEYFSEHSNKTIVIPNGVNFRDFDELPDLSYSGNPYVVYGKEWLYHFDDIIAVSNSIKGIDFVTTVWPKNIEPPDNVHIIGLQTHRNMLSIIKNSSALLLTGSEVSPTMLLESWALSVPVIARNIDGSREMMQNTDDSVCGGYLYDDWTELFEYIYKIVGSSDNFLGEEGHNVVTYHYQWKDLIEKYIDLYSLMML